VSVALNRLLRILPEPGRADVLEAAITARFLPISSRTVRRSRRAPRCAAIPSRPHSALTREPAAPRSLITSPLFSDVPLFSSILHMPLVVSGDVCALFDPDYHLLCFLMGAGIKHRVSLSVAEPHFLGDNQLQRGQYRIWIVDHNGQ